MKSGNRQWVKVFLLCGLLVWLIALAAPEVAGQPAPARAGLKIPVRAESGGGYLEDGRREDFRCFLNDQETGVRSFYGPQSSTIYLIVFDTVVDLARVDQARSALIEKLKELPSNYWIGILRSQDGLQVIQEPSADTERLAEQIRSIPVAGKAGLLDTLQPLSSLATGILNKTGVRVSILYITDSGIANYRADYLNPVINASDAGDLSRRFSDRAVQEQVSRIAKSLTRYTIPIFILHLEYRQDALNLAYQSGLERIASASGGQAMLCRTVDEIVPGLQGLLRQMNATTFLGVDLPPKAAKGKTKSYRVRIEPANPENMDGRRWEKIFHPLQIEREK